MSRARKNGYINPSLYSSDEEEKALSSPDEDAENVKKSTVNTRTRTKPSKRKSSADAIQEKTHSKRKRLKLKIPLMIMFPLKRKTVILK